MLVLVLLPLVVLTCCLEVTSGATTSAVVICALMASASALVRVEAEPDPPLTVEPKDLCVPGMTTSRLEPSASIFDSIFLVAPWPIETMAMTEPIPITMPRIVKADRGLLADSE